MERDELGKLEEEVFSRFFGALTENGRPDPRSDKWTFLTTTIKQVIDQTVGPYDEAASKANKKTTLKPPGTPTWTLPRTDNGRMYGGLDAYDLVLFCDTSRYLPIAGPQEEDDLYQDAGSILLDDRIGCFTDASKVRESTNPMSPHAASAWATNGQVRPDINGESSGSGTHAAYIQLTPATVQQWKSGPDWHVALLDSIASLLPAQGPRSLDKVGKTAAFILFHELTHTIRGKNGELNSDAEGYGWSDCIKGSQADSYKTADCIALFAYSIYLVRQDPPIAFSSDGKARYITVP